MATHTPKLLKGGIVLMDPGSGAVRQIITLQYNPEKISRTLQVRAPEQQGGDRSEALRLIGPPTETIKLDAEIDATDSLEKPREGSNRNVVEYGIQPQLAALEMILYPASSALIQNNRLAASGTLEITPMEAPLAIFVWSKSRIAPIRLTDFSVEEQFFDTNLNPIHAKVSLGMRVLNVNDLGFRHRGGNLFMIYQQQKERLATLSTGGDFSRLGIGGIPS